MSFVDTFCGEGIATLYTVPNPFLLNKICLNQYSNVLTIVTG